MSAKGRLEKALAVADSQFFEDQDAVAAEIPRERRLERSA
jgi:hypothetical protein